MAWSFGHWLILIVALLAGLAAGWVWRGRRDTAATGQDSPVVDGGPGVGTTAVVAAPAPTATTDTERPEATVDPAPAAVAEPPAPGDADPTPTAVDPVGTDVTTDGDGTDAVEPAQPAAPAEEPAAAELAATAEPVPTTEPLAAAEPATDAEPVATAEPVADATPGEAETGPQPAAAPARAAVATPPVRPVPAATSEVADDFRRIQGVGPKMAAALQAAGIRTYRQLAELDEAGLRETIRAAGLRAAPGLATWPQQAKVLADGPDEAAAALSAAVPGDDA
ncbi:hypothetical protein [Micromonospora deserti]|uniref:Helix-hairpin-helix domain-containing protein n=1 Tax=Micromonospora deserti TaxID=2070366 RepID=A0A2W2BZH6_9ACTN|nr:hypothetical protein [Micromonospora deserti]PZF92715.1 hypothetical protein C1I99_21450 [Micromonospora deserti]